MKGRLVWMFALLVALLPAGAQSYMFKHLEVKDGLSNNQVNAICKDSEGYMWFATASGLNCYDGYGIRVCRSEPNDTTTLPGNFISSIQEDGDGFLWVQTDNGYARYNPATETFSRDVGTWLRKAGMEGGASSIYIDSEKVFWVCLSGSGQLWRYVPGGGRAVPVAFDPQGAGTLVSFAEHGDCLLMADEAGTLYALDRQTLQLKWKEDGFKELMRYEGRMPPLSLYAGRSGRVWIYCERGVGCYNLPQGRWEQLRRADEPFDAIRAVLEDKDGRVWLGKDQKGIEIIGRDGRSTCLANNPEDVRTLSNNTIEAFYEDEDGTVWVGTYKKGVSYYNESTFKFSLAEAGDDIVVKTAQVSALVSRTTGQVRFLDAQGNQVLAEDSRSFQPIDVEGTKAYTVQQVFQSAGNDEGWYGLGQHQADEFNYKGKNEELFQYNTKVSVPFIVSTKNYGVLWDSYSLCRFGAPRNYSQLGDVFKLYDKEGKEGALTGTYVPGDKAARTLVRRENVDYKEWRELNTRWYQFGAFCPLSRAHGQYPYREVWNIAPKGPPACNSIVYYTKLRYNMMPYIYSMAGMTHFQDYTIMRPLVMDGPALMVAPVHEYGARKRELYFPAGCG